MSRLARTLAVVAVVAAAGFGLAACGDSQTVRDRAVQAEVAQAQAQADTDAQAQVEAARLAAASRARAQAESARVAAEAQAHARSAADAEAARVAAEAAAAEAARVAAEEQAAADQRDAAEDEQAAADQRDAAEDEQARILREGFTDENGVSYSPETVQRGVDKGIEPGNMVPGYLRCGTLCGETPTSGEVQSQWLEQERARALAETEAAWIAAGIDPAMMELEGLRPEDIPGS